MIKTETFDFLKELVNNNNREWFQANKPAYEKSRENVVEFTGKLLGLLHKIDPGIDEALDPKKSVMRIYRDIRFSKNKTPYKNNFGISIPTMGLRNGGVEYYMHIQPGKSFIAGGYWMPEADHLKAIRQEIDYNGGDLDKIITNPEFKSLFGNLRQDDKLKTVPKGYDADNEHIELLKLKSFIVTHDLKDKELLNTNSAENIAEICSKLHPLNVFLKNALA
jgi:uncharacterized protein (TIGR02453 family)